MGVKSFKRYEKKFLLNKEQKDKLMPIILEHMDYDKYCLNGNVYTIYNIYYDTPSNTIISKSIMKPPFKEKLRLRSYNSNVLDDELVFLEIKRKTNKIVTKRRVLLTPSEATNFVVNKIKPVRQGYLDNQIIDELDYFINLYNVSPNVYISYKRIALFDKENPDFRLTFDFDIITRRDNLTLQSDRYGEKILGDDYFLLEIKIKGAIPKWLVEMLTELKIYTISFSKYGEEYRRKVLGV